MTTRPHDRSWTIALCAALIVHAALAIAAMEVAIRQSLPIRLPGMKVANPPDMITVLNDEQLGDSSGSGYAINESAGDQQLHAREAPQDQALLSRDPVGPGEIGDPPSDSVLPQGGSAAAIEQTRPLALLIPQSESMPLGPGATAIAVPKLPSVALVTTSEPKPAETIGADHPPADPAPQSDSESDAFTTLGSIEFRGGEMRAQLGRNHKSIRPRLDLAAMYDLVASRNPTMQVKLRLDDEGHPADVEIVKSTGSNALDQAMKIALYQWWFEPIKNRGQDIVVMTISWR